MKFKFTCSKRSIFDIFVTKPLRISLFINFRKFQNVKSISGRFICWDMSESSGFCQVSVKLAGFVTMLSVRCT
jgi:hypothetical protein